MPAYAIIKLGSKQYRVSEGERLLVDRLPVDEAKTFHPEVMLHGDNGKVDLAPKGVQVTARVVGHELGEKIRIGKYRRRTGYRRHTGHRSRLTEIEIESIGKKGAKKADAPQTESKPAASRRTSAKPPAKAAGTTTTKKES